MTNRILRNTPTTLTFIFTDDNGDPQDADSAATVTITKGDGTALVTNAATTRTAVGIYVYQLAGQSSLNKFTADCTGIFDSSPDVVSTELEIVGGFLFSVADLRNYDSVLTEDKYPDDAIVTAREFVENEFEDTCGRAFVQRYMREVLTGDNTRELVLKKPEPAKLLSLTVNGTDVLSSYVTVVDRDDARVLLRRHGVWPGPGHRGYFFDGFDFDNYGSGPYDNIVIEYEYGPKAPPSRIVEMAKKRARSRLVSSQARIDERATLMQIEGFGTFNLATPGQRGVITGIPDVDMVLSDYTLETRGVL